jgi:hypothetical protein
MVALSRPPAEPGRSPTEHIFMQLSLKTLLVVTLLVAFCIAGVMWLRWALEWRLPSVIVSTRIAEAGVTVNLRGPDMKRHYWYDVITDDGRTTRRFLGPIADESLEPVLLTRSDNGQLRLQWGESPRAGFCILDLDRRMIVQDANAANPSKEPFYRTESTLTR